MTYTNRQRMMAVDGTSRFGLVQTQHFKHTRKKQNHGWPRVAGPFLNWPFKWNVRLLWDGSMDLMAISTNQHYHDLSSRWQASKWGSSIKQLHLPMIESKENYPNSSKVPVRAIHIKIDRKSPTYEQDLAKIWSAQCTQQAPHKYFLWTWSSG